MPPEKTALYGSDIVGNTLLNWRIRRVLPLLKGRLLDVGCGCNRLVHHYKSKYGGDGIGIDVYPWEGVDTVIEDAGKLPFDDGSFDTVTCLAALNHIPNRLEFLKESHRILAPDGQLIVTMIPSGISKIWHRLRKPWDPDQNERGMKEGEKFGFSAAEMTALFSQAQFTLAERRRFMLGMNTIYTGKKAVYAQKKRVDHLSLFATERY